MQERGNIPFHARNIDDVYRVLEVDRRGLTGQEAARRLETVGPNTLGEEQKINYLGLLLHHLMNPLVAVLVVAAVISLIAGKQIDFIVILVVIVLNTLIGFVQEFRAERSLQALQSSIAPETSVIRCRPDGECQEERVPFSDVVPGDLISLSAGNRVPADARVVQAANLEADEAMLTGESLPVAKGTEALAEDLATADRTNLVFAGTLITGGRGLAVVYATGAQTEMGQIATLIRETEKVETPIQRQTASLGRMLGILAVGVGALTLLLGLLRQLPLTDVFLFALASIVSTIPEGLPAVMTITLAVGVNRMARRNAIIRRLQAVDTLGAASAICTDKTGTLTTNEMTVQQILAGSDMVQVSGVGYSPDGRFERGGQPVDPQQDAALRRLLETGALCNDSRLASEDEQGNPRWTVIGDPTEGALLSAAAKAGIDQAELLREQPRLHEIPFDSKNKYMVTFHRHPREGQVVYMKGAPEDVLRFSSQFSSSDQAVQLEQAHLEHISAASEAMAGAALRVLGFAYRPLTEGETPEQLSERITAGEPVGLIFAGLQGMIDPPRPEVPEAVERCQSAGIRVLMATGDHQTTAEAIAREIGILNGGGRSISGIELEKLSDQALDQAMAETQVFARVSPRHKQRIVESLQRGGHVVAMTGDGVNDAPALKGAEIGVAMGITGTDVTKETAEMVLADDNFASIVNAVEEGRLVFQNVRKVVKFLIATNLGEDLTIIGSLLFLPAAGLILAPVQILWVNLVTDGLLDITIALEPKEADLMEEKPRRPDQRILSRPILAHILYMAAIMAAGTLFLYSQVQGSGDPARAQTTAFATIAMFQVFNALNVRSASRSLFQLGLFSNPYLLGAMAVSVFLLVLATTLPLLQVALGTMALTLPEWGRIVAVASSIFIIEEIRKWVVRSRRARASR